MKKAYLLSALLAFSGFTVYSQLQVPQARWWYFGDGGGVDFNPNPLADPNGVMFTYEGCSAISGPNGALYFYTDGTTVYNANHTTMTNGTGLAGGGSSTQSGQVFPYPGSTTLYYLFTQAQNIGANGMRYSVIDMSMSGGLGAVTNIKNVFLGNSFSEKIAGVKKSNGYWVCTLKLPGDTLYAYEVTTAGVNPVPVKSNTGINLTTGMFYGCMKANPAGTLLAAGHQGMPNVVHLFDFDKNTGMVTGTRTISCPTTSGEPYGVEFSPNGDILYTQSWAVGDLRQFDITQGTAAAISASAYMLGSTASGGGSIQTGPDMKMYNARFGMTYIGQVASPDVYGAGASYTNNAVPLSAGDVSRWGLPLFLASHFGASIEVTDNCYNDTTWFTADTNNLDSMYWVFGDPNSGANNFASGLNVGHVYTDTGTFTVQLVIFHANMTDTVTEEVYIYPRQTADFGLSDTSLCVGLEFTLSVDQPFATYLWHDNSTDSAYTVSSPDDLVMVTVFGVCDTVSDTVDVDYFQPFVVDIQDDSSFCDYDTMVITTGLVSNSQNLYQHLWSTGSTSNTITVTQPGTYSVTVSEGICSYADTGVYTFYPHVSVELGNDSSFCYKPMVILGPKTQTNVVTYVWENNSTSPTRPVTETGDYSVTVYGLGGYCKAEDDVTWSLWFEPKLNLGNDTSFCHNDILTLTPYAESVFPLEFLWNNNSNQSFLNVNSVGLYWVEVSDQNCHIRDSIIVDHYPILEVDLGQDIETCDGLTSTLKPHTTLPVNSFHWNTGESTENITVSKSGLYKVTVSNNLCSNVDDINVFYFDYPAISLGNDTAICPNDSIYFDVSVPFKEMEYLWSNASKMPTQGFLPKSDSTVYWVRATNVVCATTDTIVVSIASVPSAFVGNDTLICPEGGHQLLVTNDPRIKGVKWSDGSSKQYLNISDSGEYTVSVFDGKCTTTGYIHVGYKEVPTVADVTLDVPNTDNEICLGEEFQFDVNDPRFTAYLWHDGSRSSHNSASSEGIYWVQATHECGVVADTLELVRCECPVWLPNAFNPNGDNMNDKFMPESECGFLDYKFAIYDRWGEQLFYSEDPTESWDGTHLGQKSPAGAYSWNLTYRARNDRKSVKKNLNGSFVLLR